MSGPSEEHDRVSTAKSESDQTNVSVRKGSNTGRPGQDSAAKVRRLIVRVLADGGPMTAEQLQRDVTKRLSGARGGVVKQQLRVLRDGDYIDAVEGDARKVSLTDTGRRWAIGIRALSASGGVRKDRRS